MVSGEGLDNNLSHTQWGPDAKTRINSFLDLAELKLKELKDERVSVSMAALVAKRAHVDSLLQKVPSVANEAAFMGAMKKNVTPQALQQHEAELLELMKESSADEVQSTQATVHNMRTMVGIFALVTVLRNEKVRTSCKEGQNLRDMLSQLLPRYAEQLLRAGEAEVLGITLFVSSMRSF